MRPLLLFSFLVAVCCPSRFTAGQQPFGSQPQEESTLQQERESETQPASGEAEPAPKLDWVDALFDRMNARGIAGGACAIVHDDQIVHLQGYGVEDRETEQPIDPHRTRLYLASVTKAFTATLILRLVDQGLLDLDADIATYLEQGPAIRRLPGSDPITLRHLLTHTAGLNHGAKFRAATTLEEAGTLEEYLEETKLSFPPGEAYRDTIVRGVVESHGLSVDEAERYVEANHD